jgi:hypothetical protein
MDFLDALKVLLRRWYAVLVGLVLIGAACGVAITRVQTGYEATGQYLLLLPADASGTKTPTNPFLNLQSGLVVTGSLIAGTLTTKESQRSLATAGFTSKYAIGLNPGGGPILSITTDDTDPSMAVATRDEVIRRLDAELLRIQVAVDVPRTQLIHATESGVSPTAEVVPGRKIKALAVIAGGGLVLTLVVTFSLDRYLLSHRRRRPRDASRDDDDATRSTKELASERRRPGRPGRRPAGASEHPPEPLKRKRRPSSPSAHRPNQATSRAGVGKERQESSGGQR